MKGMCVCMCVQIPLPIGLAPQRLNPQLLPCKKSGKMECALNKSPSHT